MDKIKNITLSDESETKEAQALLEKHKKIYLLWIIPFCLFVTFVTLLINALGPYAMNNLPITNPLSMITSILLIISLIIVPNICYKHMKPYRDLLKIARSNDRIRHEEKIRCSERLRNQTMHLQRIAILQKQKIQPTIDTINRPKKIKEDN